VVNEAIDELKLRYGKMTNPEVSKAGDSLFGTISQESTEFSKDGLIELEKVAKKLQKDFIGVKKDDAVSFDIQKLFTDASDLEGLTGLKDEEYKELSGEFTFKVKNVNRVEPSEMNQEFFDKIFGEGKVKTEEEFVAEYKKIFEENFDKESEYLLSHQLQEKILKDTKLEIPEEFYKKWILATNKELKEEDLEKDFEHYVRDLKWTLIKNKVGDDNDIKIENDDLVDYTKKMFRAQFGGMQLNEEMEANIAALNEIYDKAKELERKMAEGNGTS